MKLTELSVRLTLQRKEETAMIKCPKCSAEIEPQPVVVTDPGFTERHYCMLCGKRTGRIVMGMHGGVCPECLNLATDMIEAASGQQ